MSFTKLLRLALIAMVAATMTTRLSALESNKTPVAYFLEQRPADLDAPSNLPRDAKDVIVAKVRLGQGLDVVRLGGRHCEGCTNDIYASRFKIVEVLSGSAEVGQILNVLFGQRSELRQFMAYPYTPDQRNREYIVVTHMGEDGKRRLVPFEISQYEYQKWHDERGAYQHLRNIAPPR